MIVWRLAACWPLVYHIKLVSLIGSACHPSSTVCYRLCQRFQGLRIDLQLRNDFFLVLDLISYFEVHLTPINLLRICVETMHHLGTYIWVDSVYVRRRWCCALHNHVCSRINSCISKWYIERVFNNKRILFIVSHENGGGWWSENLPCKIDQKVRDQKAKRKHEHQENGLQ